MLFRSIDGRVNATGSSRDLTLINNFINGSNNGFATIRLINDASNNTIKYCTIKGTASDLATGTLLFSTAKTTTGNSLNTIDNNDFTSTSPTTLKPTNAIYSLGTTACLNSNNTISNNNFSDFNYGVNLSSYTTAWSISGNSFYGTSTSAICMIYVASASGTDFNISNNYIGGSGPACGGTAWTKSNSQNDAFTGIYLNVGTGTASNIQGNTIKNISWSNSGASSFNGIVVDGGDVNVGTTTTNIIGSLTGTGSINFMADGGANFYGISSKTAGILNIRNNTIGGITFTATKSSDSYLYGIYNNATGTSTIQSNTIGSIIVANGVAMATNFCGIMKTNVAGTTLISSNIIGSTSIANSINATSASSVLNSSQFVYGIKSSGLGAVTISDNTIANLTNGTSNISASATGAINGISFNGGAHTVTNNTIRDLTIANANASDPVAGIAYSNLMAGNAPTITNNTIYNLSNTCTSLSGSVSGVYYKGSITAATISKNFIHSLSAHAASSVATLYGIKIASGNTTCSNNIISLNGNNWTTLFGIFDSGATSNVYFNTVYIYGKTPEGNDRNSNCLYSNAVGAKRSYKNNVLVNKRISGNINSCVFLKDVVYLTIDYNDYYFTPSPPADQGVGTSNTAIYRTLANFKSYTLQDTHSVSVDPSLSNAGGTTAADYMPSATALLAQTGTGIATDYAGTSRSTIRPAMGAYEFAVYGAVTVTSTLGTGEADYNSLKLAFDAINSGIHKGDITVKINASTIEDVTAALYQSGYGSTSNYTTVNIYPTATGLSVSGNLAAPLIDLNGADNVTIDGRVNATGSAKELIIVNSSSAATANTSTIRFTSDATNNTVKYCTIKGSTTDAAGGVIYFLTQNNSKTGNDSNTITNNDITSADDANRPISAIASAGYTNQSRAMDNSGIVISNNNIYNFLNRGTASNGIYLAYTSEWTITGNSFFETASFVPTASVAYNVINIYSPYGGSFTLSNNYIGGSSLQCGTAGTVSSWTKTKAYNNPFTAINIWAGTIAASNIQGNVIQNFNYSNLTNGNFTGINISGLNGVKTNAEVGTTSANTIGATTGTGSIVLTNTTSDGAFYGISNSSSGTLTFQNNIIGSITVANSSSTAATNFYGIYRTDGQVKISNNTIGSETTANSINASSGSTYYSQLVYGIYSDRAYADASISGDVTIKGNTISNLTNGTTNTDVTKGKINGITAMDTKSSNLQLVVSDNTVRDLTIANANSFATNDASITGIAVSNSVPSISSTVTGNTIYNLSNSYPSFAGSVIGLYYNGSWNQGQVAKNFIYGLSVTGASSTTASLYGAKIDGGAVTFSNNIVNVGGNSLSNIYGIYDSECRGNAHYLYFNTIHIFGTLSGGTNKSYALYNGDGYAERTYKNNVFSNIRSTAGGSNLNYAAYIYGGRIYCNFNDYWVTGTGGTVGYYNANKAAIPIVTGDDAQSKSYNPLFASVPPGTTASNFVPGASSPASPSTGILTDYAGTKRAAIPAMGAFEMFACGQPTVGGTIAASQISCGSFDPAPLTSTLAASGQSGVLEYKWQSSVTSSTAGFSDIASSNVAEYDPSALSFTTWYKRVARAVCIGNWTGAAESNVVKMTVDPVTVGGAVSGTGSITFGNSTGTMTLSGHTGTVVKWQKRVAEGIWSDIVNTDLTCSEVPSSLNTWEYRAVLKSASCPEGYSTALSIAVSPIAATLGTFANITKKYGDPDFALVSPTTNSPGAFSYISSNTGVATISGNTVTIHKAGVSTITASQAASAEYGGGSNTATLTVSKVDQIITLSPLPVGSVALKDFVGAIQVTASSSSSLAVNIALGSGSAATLNSSKQLINIGTTGTIVLNITQAGDDNYNSASISYTFDVVKSNQIITFNGLTTKTYGEVPFVVSASGGGSGNAVTFASSDPTIATCTGTNGSTVTILSAGTVEITASQAGNSGWNPAAAVSRMLTIEKIGATLTLADLTKNYGDAAFTVAATSNSGGAITYGSSNTNVATINGNQITLKGAGTATISVHQDADANYLAANATTTLTVGKGTAVTTLADLAKNYGDAVFTVVATSNSNGTITYGSSNLNVATFNGDKATVTGVGTSTISVNQAATANFNAAATTNATLTVGESVATLVLADIAKNYGDGVFTVAATSTSGGVITYTSSNSGVATISGNQVTITGAGTSTITVNQAADANFNAVSTTATVTVSKIAATLTLANSIRKYGDVVYTLAATSSSGGTITYSSDNTNVAAISGNQVTIAGAGSSTITVNQAADANYFAATTTAMIKVEKADQVLSLSIPTSARLNTFVGTSVAIVATSTSGLPVTVTKSGSATATLSGTPGNYQLSGVSSTGIVTFSAEQAGNDNYNPALSISQSFNVELGNQSISFGTLSSKTFGDASFTVSATGGSSGNPVTFTSSDEAIATCTGTNGTTITITGAGVVVISASQAGNSNWNPAPDVPRNLTMGKAIPVITFENISKNIFDEPFYISATSTGTGSFIYGTSNTTVATLEGNLVTIKTTGTAYLSAALNETINYTSATVQATLTVSKANQTSIYFSSCHNVFQI